MGFANGDVFAAVGKKTVKLEKLELDLSDITPEEMLRFKGIPMEGLGSTKAKEVGPAEAKKIQELYVEWFRETAVAHEPAWAGEDEGSKKKLNAYMTLVIRNLDYIIKEFSYAFGVRKEQLEKAEKELGDQLKKQEEAQNPQTQN